MTTIQELLFKPTILNSLRQNLPPVTCIVWKGNDDYDTITLDNVYPFDTMEDIKRMICTYYNQDENNSNPIFHPNFLFVGIPMGEKALEESNPELDTLYHALDFLWYPQKVKDIKDTHTLKNPVTNLRQPDDFFFTSDGLWSSPGIEIRSRSTIDHVFLNWNNEEIPILHVYPFHTVFETYKDITGEITIKEEEWNRKFGAYFIHLNANYVEPTEEDIQFIQKIKNYVDLRVKNINRLNAYLEESIEDKVNPDINGIRQLRLIWDKPVQGFEGCGSMFYHVLVNEKRPYIRLFPSDGSPITKLHVQGVLPIPSLDDPRVLQLWGKENSPTPDSDFCMIKYVQNKTNYTLYGTIQISNNGTINLILQPPKDIKQLRKEDFGFFNERLHSVFEGLPQKSTEFKWREMALTLSFKLDEDRSKQQYKFTKETIQKRLPYFQSFFQEIPSLPNESSIISLRYKAVSHYAAEDKYFTFLTQYATMLTLNGEGQIQDTLIKALQNEFLIPTILEAATIVANWSTWNGTYSVEIPEEGEFIKDFNPGIDIHIYEQHPSYTFYINRIEDYETYLRIYTLLCLLFLEDYFFTEDLDENQLWNDSNVVEKTSLENEIDEVKSHPIQPEPISKVIYDDLDDLENEIHEGEVLAEGLPSEVNGSIKQNRNKKEEKQEEVTKLMEKTKQKIVNPEKWFLNKLQEIDPKLFDYKVPKGESGYSRLCGAVDNRQPVIMTQNQYDRMRKIYEDDTQINWIIYPRTEDTEVEEVENKEITITIMRYGSDANNVNYYFCPEYYCLSDELMILPKDFEGTMDRYGNRKKPNTCPFCHGELITGKGPEKGHTVIRRIPNNKTKKHMGYIGFLKESTHPSKTDREKYPYEIQLPCCFTKETDKKKKEKKDDKKHNHRVVSNSAFDPIRSYFKEMGFVKEDEDITEEEDEEDEEQVRNMIDYTVQFEKLFQFNIQESNKDLNPGSFGVVPDTFDVYFKQKSVEIVHRPTIYQKLKADSKGFIRMGIVNSINESLLGVITPILKKTSISEVKKVLLQVMNPKIFLNSHFGNLVMEFFDPTDKSAMPETYLSLKTWSANNLSISLSSKNTYQLLRIYNSYNRFVKFINDPNQRKDLRHIQPILAEPGLLTTNGIQLIVMEDNQKEPVTIKCPPFGISRREMNDFVFISRSLQSIPGDLYNNKYAYYQLFLYTENKAKKGNQEESHKVIYRWKHDSKENWPSIVKKRIEEFVMQCQSKYRSIYTAQDGIDSMALIPLSKAIEETSSLKQSGIVKDSYNHIVGITFKVSSIPNSPLVALPVVDDGVVSIAAGLKNIYLDWEDFKAAPVDKIIKYYNKKILPLFELYPGYKIENIVQLRENEKVVAIQLANGIYIPASSAEDQEKWKMMMEKEKIGMVTVEIFQWTIDRQIAGIKSILNSAQWEEYIKGMINKDCGFDDEIIRKSSYIDFEELYQQFRLMVSNWISEGGEVRKRVEEIIFHRDLPDFEKKKRLDLFISSTLISWFYPDKEKWEVPVSFLRKDCRLIDDEKDCFGTCVWKTEGEEGKCLLHVNEKTLLGEKDREVSTPILFTKRVIDELVRFPARRKQLLKRGRISTVTKIMEPIRHGDEYIIPEDSPTWTNLLRLEWTHKILEKPKYYEEMSRELDKVEKVENKKVLNIPKEVVKRGRKRIGVTNKLKK